MSAFHSSVRENAPPIFFQHFDPESPHFSSEERLESSHRYLWIIPPHVQRSREEIHLDVVSLEKCAAKHQMPIQTTLW